MIGFLWPIKQQFELGVDTGETGKNLVEVMRRETGSSPAKVTYLQRGNRINIVCENVRDFSISFEQQGFFRRLWDGIDYSRSVTVFLKSEHTFMERIVFFDKVAAGRKLYILDHGNRTDVRKKDDPLPIMKAHRSAEPARAAAADRLGNSQTVPDTVLVQETNTLRPKPAAVIGELNI